MKRTRRSLRSRSYGRRQDYRNVIRRREIGKEILIWAVEILLVVMLAFICAYFFWR